MAAPRVDPPARRGLVVAIDGPAGSGKSTVARRVAEVLGLRYLDTGAMYRAVTWAALERGVDLADQAAVADLARRLPLEVSTDPAHPRVTVGDVEVTAAIREGRISAQVSRVAANLAVRAELVARQQRLVEPGGVVLEGRDTTTVVAPHAAVRILLTAHHEQRLARRAREVHGHAGDDALAATRDQVLRRDADDAGVVDFHTAAAGVVTVDTSDQPLDAVVARVLDLVAAAGDPAGRR